MKDENMLKKKDSDDTAVASSPILDNLDTAVQNRFPLFYCSPVTSHQSHSYTFWTLSTLPAFAGDIAVQDCSGGSALALRELFRSPVRHGRHYNKTILDILDIPIQSSLTTEFTENSLFHHEVHEGKTKGLKQRKPVVSECMRRNRINPLTTCILFMNFMVKLPFLILHILSIPVKPSCFPSAPICGSFRDFREPLNTTVYQSS